MAIEELYISHSEFNWTGHKSTLLNNANIKKALITDEKNVYHTSIADMQFENIQRTVQSAKRIILIDLNLFSDNIRDADYFQYGRLVNELFKVKDKVDNFDWIDKLNFNFFNDTVKPRLNDNPILWTAGCSVTYGSGVDYADRWGSILSSRLNMPEVSLSLPGQSMTWCADQILRSDIKPGDIVIWGLTVAARVEYAKDWHLYSVIAGNYDSLPVELQHYNLDYFDSQTKFVYTIKNILQVKNYCEKVGATLYIANLLEATWLTPIFNELPTYIDFCINRVYNESLTFLDVGNDDIHPGPKQHRYYAERIFNLIKENNHGKTI